MGISSNRRPRKPGFKDEEIDVAELAGMSNMKGMLSFLDTKPEDYARMLIPRPIVSSSPPQAIESESNSRSLPASSLPSVSNHIPDSNLLPENLEKNALLIPNLPIGSQQISSLRSRSLPASNLLTASNHIPDSNLLPENVEKNALLVPNLPIGLQQISSLPPGSNLLPNASDRTDDTDSNQLPDSTLPSGSDLPGIIITNSEEVKPTTYPHSSLLPGSPLKLGLAKDPGRVNPTVLPGSNLLSRSDLLISNGGRTVRLRPARSVQDAHTNGEHLLLTAMWKKGTPESDDTRLLRAGLAELSRWTGSHKTSCRAYIRALIAKLALEEAETFDAAAGSEGARVYRIFSFNTILERRRRANLTHVIRTGAVWFVDPKTGEKLQPTSNLLSGSNLLPDSNVPPDSKLPSHPGSNHPPIPGSNQPLVNKNKEQLFKQTTATTLVHEALCAYGSVDAEAVTRLVRNCKYQVIDCTEQEIVHFIHKKGSLVKARESRIQNPIGFLIDAVPKCFTGETFRLYRQAQSATDGAAEDHDDRDLEWGREHESDLSDPGVPEEVKQVIRRCLGGSPPPHNSGT